MRLMSTLHHLPLPLQLLQSEQMITYLSADDVEQMQQYFAAIPSGQATYTDFYPMAKELILRVYRVKDPSEVCGRRGEGGGGEEGGRGCTGSRTPLRCNGRCREGKGRKEGGAV